MSRITQVFYGNDCLPYKDSERTVHYPITGSSFAGSSNVNELHFYVRDIGGVDNISWVAIVKLPNGKILYQLLTDIHPDSEINEYYVTFNLSQFYTQLKGDIYISLNGCNGQVTITTDEETDISTIQGEIDNSTVVATGAIKFSINYAPQRPIGFSFDLDQYQLIINALANKPNYFQTFVITPNIASTDISKYEDGQLFFDVETKAYYEKDSSLTPPYKLFKTIDTGLDLESALPVQNKVISNAIFGMEDIVFKPKVSHTFYFDSPREINYNICPEAMKYLRADRRYLCRVYSDNENADCILYLNGLETHEVLTLSVQSNTIFLAPEDIGDINVYCNTADTTITVDIYEQETSVNQTFDIATNTTTTESSGTYTHKIVNLVQFEKGKRYEIDVELDNAYEGTFDFSLSQTDNFNAGYTPLIGSYFNDNKFIRRFICTQDNAYFVARFIGSGSTISGNITIKEIPACQMFNYVSVAANNSSKEDKDNSDFVCTGTNDQDVINFALLYAYWNNQPKVQLASGTYNIQNFNQVGGNGACAILLPYDLVGIKEIELCGETCQYGFTHSNENNNIPFNGTVFYVDQTGYSNIPNSACSILDSAASTTILSGISLKIHDIGFLIYDSQKALTAFNARGIDRIYAEKLTFVGYVGEMLLDQDVGLTKPQTNVPVEGFIGIQMGTGSNDPQGYSFKNIGIWGFYEGFKVGGEHLTMEGCSATLCVYGYTFGNYDYGANPNTIVHPITMINCCDERNQNFPLFKKCGYNQDITMIGFNLEQITNRTPGLTFNNKCVCEWNGFRGKILYTIMSAYGNGASGGNVVDYPLWEEGYGENFECHNMAQKKSGTTAERLSYAPNYNQLFFDTTLNKLMVCTNPDTKTWVTLADNEYVTQLELELNQLRLEFYEAVVDIQNYEFDWLYESTLPLAINNQPVIYSAGTDMTYVEGNSFVYNQLVQNGNFESTSGWTKSNQSSTFSVSNNIASFTASTAGDNVYNVYGSITGHKYLAICYIKLTTANTNVYLYSYRGGISVRCQNTTDWQLLAGIGTANNDGGNIQIIDNRTSDRDNIDIKDVQVFDLTQNGLDSVTTVDQAISELAKRGINVYEYNAYNTGKIVSSQPTKLISKNSDNEIIDERNLSSPILRSVGSVRDSEAQDGTITRRVIKQQLTGNETWGKSSSGDTTYFVMGVPGRTQGTGAYPILSQGYQNNEISQLNTNIGINSVLVNNNQLRIRPENASSMTVEQFKTWLSNQSIFIQYPLEEPTTEQGTPLLENIKIEEGGSIEIEYESDNDVPANFKFNFATSKIGE